MSAFRKGIEVVRDCRATAIPSGETVVLASGTSVYIEQQLGDSVTVRTERGQLLRLDGGDVDALGLDPNERNVVLRRSGPFSMDQVTDALNTVYDPEIPVSIVELGLVYRCEEITRDDGTRLISIDMSMTAPGCGMGDVLRSDAARAVKAVPGVDAVEVALVWDPPWSMDRMSDETRLQLGLL